MTRAGFKSLCYAMAKLEATKRAPGLPSPIRIRLPLHSGRPQFVDLRSPKKPVQSTFDWPTNQIRLFEGTMHETESPLQPELAYRRF
jgi:hypothetical protein